VFDLAKKLFEEVADRLFHRIFVCRKCKSKIRTDYAKVRDKKVKCRKCGSKSLRPKRKERKI